MRLSLLEVAAWAVLVACAPEAPAQDDSQRSPNSEPRAAAKDAPVEVPRTVAWLGVAVDEVDPLVAEQLALAPHHGLSVEAVVPESPADRAGIRRFDILTKLDDQWLVLPRQLQILIQWRPPHSAASLTCVRKGEEMVVAVELGERQLEAPFAVAKDQTRFFVEAQEIDNENLKVSLRDRDHSVVLESRAGGDRYATVTRHADGQVVFQGLVTTEKQREKIPGDIRAKIEKLGVVEDGKWVWQFDLKEDVGEKERPPGLRAGHDRE